MSVSKNDRVLLFVNEVSTGGDPDLEWLYKGIESIAEPIVDAQLTSMYRKVIKLEGSQATEKNFIQKFSELGADATVKAIDVIIILHGSTEKLWFYNSAKAPVARLKYDLSCLNVRGKARLFYSTACYGATHADDLVAAGFDCASGALGVNANSAVEFPVVVDALQDGRTHKQGIEDGSVGLEAQDAIAKAVGFETANSVKKIVGNGSITINSSPTFEGKAYFFKDGQYVRYDLKTEAVDSGYPLSISQSWEELYPKIDTAVIWPDDRIYFFKGNQYLGWNLKTNTADVALQPISTNWGSFMANGVDAAINWPNGKVYFFKGNQYIRWDVATGKMDSGYPQQIGSKWPSFMANGVDAAINWGNGKAYFFKGDQYIRMTIGADTMDEGYPQKISSKWPSFMAKGVDAAFLWLRSI